MNCLCKKIKKNVFSAFEKKRRLQSGARVSFTDAEVDKKSNRMKMKKEEEEVAGI